MSSNGKGPASVGPGAFIPPRVTRRNPLPDFTTPFDDQELGRTAYHEAAHAVVGQVTGQNPFCVSVIPTKRLRGVVRQRSYMLDFAFTDRCPPAWALATVWGAVCTKLAGPVAEYLWFNEPCPSDYFECGGYDLRGDKWIRVRGDDCGDATTFAKKILRRSDAEMLYIESCFHVRRFLNRRDARRAVASIARKLHASPVIDRDAILRMPWCKSASLLRPNDLIEKWAPRIRHAERRPTLPEPEEAD